MIGDYAMRIFQHEERSQPLPMQWVASLEDGSTGQVRANNEREQFVVEEGLLCG